AAVRGTPGAGVGVRGGGGKISCVLGGPAPGGGAEGGGRQGFERKIFHGKTQIAVFSRDHSETPGAPLPPNSGAFRRLTVSEGADFRFVRFRPPPLETTGDDAPPLPYIRLDRALQFLIGDRLT